MSAIGDKRWEKSIPIIYRLSPSISRCYMAERELARAIYA